MIDRREMLFEDRIVPVVEPDEAVVELTASALAFVERQPRAHCATCGMRRVLYRIGLRTILRSPEFTEARCASCWGIAPEKE